MDISLWGRLKKNSSYENLFILRWMLMVCIISGSFFLALSLLNQVPNPAYCEIDNSGNFVTSKETVCAPRAHELLGKLTNFGPKPAGSYENEVKTLNLLLSELESINKTSSGYIHFEYETQYATGMGPFNRYYSDVQNIVARVSSVNTANNSSLLINCHFDSAKEGPGASDDTINCVAMLEVIRSILINPEITMNYDVIFLFNGAEESGLLASHGFITQHRWESDVIAYINLEAVGSGGREMLFQTTSKRLMQSYIQSAPYPFSNVVGQEIFQSGIIPSDTDFRIFRDYGNIAEGGLDFAFIKNGYVYHTIHDKCDIIPNGSIQQAGDNLLHITTDFVNGSKEMDEIPENTSNVDLVFFDMFGLFMVSYSWNPTGIALNICFSLICFLMPLVDILLMKKVKEVKIKTSILSIIVCILSLLVIWTLSLGLSLLIGYLLGSNGFSMSWYTTYSFLFLLYALPVLIISHMVFTVLKIVIKEENQLWDAIEDFFFHGCNMVFGVMCLIFTAYSIKSSFLFNFSLIFNILWWSLYRSSTFILLLASSTFHHTNLSFKEFNQEFKHGQSIKWVSFITYVLFQILPMMMWSYIIIALLTVLIPTMGRNGVDANPDMTISILVTSSTLILLHFFFPLLVKSSKQYIFIIVFTVVFSISVAVLCCSSAGFPYHYDNTNPTTKRLSILYTKRSFLDTYDNTSMVDGGYQTVRYDYSWTDELMEAVPEYRTSHIINETECLYKISCGYPYGTVGDLWTTNDTLPIIPNGNDVNLRVVSVENLDNWGGNVTNITMELSGPSSIKLLLSPYPDIYITSSGPFDDLYSILHVDLIRASISPSPQRFWLLVSGWKEDERWMDAVIIGYFRHGDGVLKPGDSEFVDKHPDWVSPFSYIVDYKYYYF